MGPGESDGSKEFTLAGLSEGGVETLTHIV